VVEGRQLFGAGRASVAQRSIVAATALEARATSRVTESLRCQALESAWHLWSAGELRLTRWARLCKTHLNY